jgi:large subunit ribosomal protein L3
MAGRMGGERSTTMNLVIYGVDVERGLLLVRGAIPGPTGALVMVRSAAKRVSPDAFEPAAEADAAAGATEASEGADQ